MTNSAWPDSEIATVLISSQTGSRLPWLRFGNSCTAQARIRSSSGYHPLFFVYRSWYCSESFEECCSTFACQSLKVAEYCEEHDGLFARVLAHQSLKIAESFDAYCGSDSSQASNSGVPGSKHEGLRRPSQKLARTSGESGGKEHCRTPCNQPTVPWAIVAILSDIQHRKIACGCGHWNSTSRPGPQCWTADPKP